MSCETIAAALSTDAATRACHSASAGTTPSSIASATSIGLFGAPCAISDHSRPSPPSTTIAVSSRKRPVWVSMRGMVETKPIPMPRSSPER